jgi:type I restriction enzyme M protein
MTSEQLKQLEKNLWTAAERLRVDSDLKSNEYATPVLGIIFLKFADNKYSMYEDEIKAELETQKNSRRQRTEKEIAVSKCGFYLPPKARYNYLLNLPGDKKLDVAIKEAMEAIEEHKGELKDTLPKDEYFNLTRSSDELLPRLLRIFADIPTDASGDLFGKVYEYFLGEFALAEGQGGGEFFTPTSVVKYMVEVIEPYSGEIYDPACGSGGMFVQSAKFIERRKAELHDTSEKNIFVCGQEKTADTVKLAKMNLVVNRLRGEIKQANTFYQDEFNCYGRFDYVMANPPFNVKDVNVETVENKKYFNEYGLPRNKSNSSKKDSNKETISNANYLWINLFATSLKDHGKAALVMPNQASDESGSEKDIRTNLINAGVISQMVTLPSNMFYTVILPATLWFFEKDREKNEEILFIDARNVYRQIDRAHREFSEEQIENLAIITRLYKGERERYIELVSKYIARVYELSTRLDVKIKEAYDAVKVLKENFIEWFSVSKLSLDEERNEKLKGFGVEDKISKLNLYSSEDALSQYRRIEELYKKYITEYRHEKIESSNKIQKKLVENYNRILEGLNEFYKSVEKYYRRTTRLYEFFEKELKIKDDNRFKEINKIKDAKIKLDELNRNIHEANYFNNQSLWLQERFPEAKYNNVIGLCKAANLDDIKEQDYSLNPGRYVGVVIEEDGLTEEEFQQTILELNSELMLLNKEAHKLELNIVESMRALVKVDEE